MTDTTIPVITDETVIIYNSDGTYTFGVASDCPYGCAVNSICGTSTECAVGGGIGLVAILLIILAVMGLIHQLHKHCGHHFKRHH